MADISLNPAYISRAAYSEAFGKVQKELISGNSFLCNLTAATELHPDTALNLRDIYHQCHADYRLWIDFDALRRNFLRQPDDLTIIPQAEATAVPQQFVVFSPEAFIRTSDQRIYTYPMKGTALVPKGADRNQIKKQLLADPKELAEHITVVDLLRNDLGRIGTDVRVEDFRHTSTITGPQSELLQVSSTISAALHHNWHNDLGNLLFEILPAGSVSGAPKHETCRIIKEAEQFFTDNTAAEAGASRRGYYSGIAAIYDGNQLDSAVLIRYIEERQTTSVSYPIENQVRWFFRSGGGITINSREQSEYRELCEKIRLPQENMLSIPPAGGQNKTSSPQSESLIETMLMDETSHIPLLKWHHLRFVRSLLRCAWHKENIPSLDQFEQWLHRDVQALQKQHDAVGGNSGPESSSTYRCRLVYSTSRVKTEAHHIRDMRSKVQPTAVPTQGFHTWNIQIKPFERRTLRRLAFIEAPGLNYELKSEDRSQFEALHRKFPGFDEIIITKDGYITDGTWSNVYLRIPGEDLLLTPCEPLLAGCRRAAELHEGRCRTARLNMSMLRGILPAAVAQPADNTQSEASPYPAGTKIGLMNALNAPGELAEFEPADLTDLGVWPDPARK